MQTHNNLLPEFPKPFIQTKWVCVSSLFFLVPAIYALLNVGVCKWLYIYGYISILNSILSVNHWKKAEYGIRRTLDKSVAYFAFIFYSGTSYVVMPIYLSLSTIILVSSSYLVSDYFSRRHYSYWYFFHMFFHFCAAVTKCMVIYQLLYL